MKKWEYSAISKKDFVWKIDDEFSREIMVVPLKVGSNDKMKWMGRAGWELCSEDEAHYIFKREAKK